MKTKILFICLLLLLLTGCEKYTIDPDEKAVNKVVARNSKAIAKKYHMRPFAIGVAMPGGDIQYLELKFQIYGPLSKNEIRKILIDAAHDFLADINSDEELCSYLKNNSFSIENVGITLFVIDASGIGVNDPDIGIAGIAKGELRYLTLILTDTSPIQSRCYETYEEALRMVTDA